MPSKYDRERTRLSAVDAGRPCIELRIDAKIVGRVRRSEPVRPDHVRESAQQSLDLGLYRTLLSPSDQIFNFEDVFYLSAMINCGIVVERVCRLPRGFRLVGTKSVIQLAEEIGLPAHRKCITSSAVESQLLAQPELVDDWLLWSADQRCSPAWYFC